MTELQKTSQQHPGTTIYTPMLNVVSPSDANDAQIMLEMPNDETIVFDLPNIPGAEDDSDIVVDEPAALEVAEEEPVEVEEKNPWDWQSRGLGGFLGWIKEMMDNVPGHSGRDTTGLERAIAYFEALDKEITRAMRTDFKNEINGAKAEEARAQIEDGLQRMVERLEKVRASKYPRNKKKKADTETGLVKEAQKSTAIHGIAVTVPLLISTIARICINGMVSGGHDIEWCFDEMIKKYKLNDREQLELLQLLMDMGYMHSSSRDRGYKIDEKHTPTSSDNFDFGANFTG